MSIPTVTVFGATGRQGGAVAKALLQDGAYNVRAVTRNPSSLIAKALVEQGAEVIYGDLDDEASVNKTLEGASACFAVTNYFEHLDAERETRQGKFVANAALIAGVDHVIYSGSESVIKRVGFSCPHFDAKAEVEEYMKDKHVSFTSVRIPAYFEVFSQFVKKSDGIYELGMPLEGASLYTMSVQDLGPCVHAILQSPEEYKYQLINLAAEYMTVQQYADILSKVLAPRIFKDAQMTADSYSKLGFPAAQDLATMFRYFQKEKCDHDIALTRKLHPNLSTFEQFVEANKEKFLTAIG